jgi:micrococcal nuclease
MISKTRNATSALLLLLFALPALADTLQGRVVRVIDGDTVVVLDAEKTQHRIRLAGIDAPERKQPFGQRSKQYLASQIAGQDVIVDWDKHDRYHRIVGKIIYDGQDVDLAMVRAGLAWWYRHYAHEQSAADRVLYEDAEDKAKAERKGLWVDPNPMPPWEWRHRR